MLEYILQIKLIIIPDISNLKFSNKPTVAYYLLYFERYIVKTDVDEFEAEVVGIFLKIEREKTHFESTVTEKRKKDKNFSWFYRSTKRLCKASL